MIIETLFSGCSTNVNEGQTIELKKSDAELVFDRASLQGDARYLKSLYQFSSKIEFLEYSKVINEGEPYTNSYYRFYNMNTKELVEIGKYAPWTVASHDSKIIMNDRYLYFFALFLIVEEDYKEQITLLRMDIQDKTFEVIEVIEDGSVHPFVYMSKLNENEFIATVVKPEKSNYTTNTAANTTRVIKYNGTTGKSETIIENKYVYTDGEADSAGTLLESVCGMDGKIYAVGRQMEANEWHYYFYTYDDQGSLLSRIEAPAIEHTMKNEAIHGFYVVGNYFTLVRYASGTQALYKVSDNQVELVIEHDEKMAFPNMNNFYSSEKISYIYYSANRYARGSEYQNTTDKSPIYALNITTGEIKEVYVDID